jgi:hypothetical protein
MALKKILVDTDIFHADNALESLHFQDGIDHQERITMRKNLLDAIGVQNHRSSSIPARGQAQHAKTIESLYAKARRLGYRVAAEGGGC